MTQNSEHTPSGFPVPAEPRITLRTPADLAEALPYLMGFHPDNSIVLVGLHGARGRFGERLRVGIPADPGEWADIAAQLADCLVRGGGQHHRPEGIAAFLCHEPRAGESPIEAMERLRPLAQHLRTACGALDVPVLEALCICAGRWWSYCCPGTGCCPPAGTELSRDGTSVMAAAAAYAGLRVPGSLREMDARYAPLTGRRADLQERALDEACAELLPRLLDGADSTTMCEETVALAEAALERFRAAPTVPESPAGDALDDVLLSDDEAAAIILGLQDRVARDRAAEWMEGDDAVPALRLWRALARRCVGAYADHAAAPVTLAGWVCWSIGDEPAARVAFGRALELDREYTFARLLNQACNHGIDPEPLRRSLRAERRKSRRCAARSGAGTAPKGRPRSDGRPGAGPGSRSASRPGARSGARYRPGRTAPTRGDTEGTWPGRSTTAADATDTPGACGPSLAQDRSLAVDHTPAPGTSAALAISSSLGASRDPDSSQITGTTGTSPMSGRSLTNSTSPTPGSPVLPGVTSPSEAPRTAEDELGW